MRKLHRFFKYHFLGIIIISTDIVLETVYLYNDYVIHRSWFFQRYHNKEALMQYSIEIALFLLLLFGGILSDRGRARRLDRMEGLKESHFIDSTAMKILEEPSFKKKLEIAISSIGEQIEICKSAFIANEGKLFNFYYKDNISKDDESFIRKNILSAKSEKGTAHNDGFLFSEVLMHDLSGYVILKPCRNISSTQIEFVRRYKRMLLPIFSNARLIIALNKSKSNAEFLVGRYKILHHFIADLHKCSTVEEAYWKLLDVSRMFFGINSATVVDVSEEQSKWHFVAIKNTPNDRLEKVENEIKNSNYRGTIARVKEKKKIIYVKDTREDTEWIPVQGSPLSWVGIPITVYNDVVAVLNIDGEKPNQFTEEDVIFAQALSDVTSSIVEKLKYMERLNINAITDSLTGLYNKREFEKRLKEEVNRATRYKRKFSIAIFDLDRFKQWNDTYGHVEGDHLLASVGTLVLSSVRTSDIAFRFGGDEFVIMFPETDTEDAVNVVRSLSLRLTELNVHERGKVSFSAGIAEYKFGENAEDFIQRADKALYKAKESKKDNIKVTA